MQIVDLHTPFLLGRAKLYTNFLSPEVIIAKAKQSFVRIEKLKSYAPYDLIQIKDLQRGFKFCFAK